VFALQIESSCPACSIKPIYYTTVTIDVPYFGEIIQTTMFCKKCGYKHSDIIITAVNEPLRYEYPITSEKDMFVRVVRSSSGTISIPEIGATVEPGPISECFVSNIEGVFERIKKIIQDMSTENTKKKKDVLKKIEKIMEGKEKATLVIDDPLGNSAIIGKKAKKKKTN
jgi:zinc finger protein